MDAHCVINWAVVNRLSWQYLRSPALDRCSLLQWSSSSVYTTISSRRFVSDSWYLQDGRSGSLVCSIHGRRNRSGRHGGCRTNNLTNKNFYRAMLCIRVTSHGPVSVSVCLSQVGVLLKRLNVGSYKQHHTIAQGVQFSDAKDLREIRPGSPPTRAPNAGRVGQNRRLLTNNRLYIENGTR